MAETEMENRGSLLLWLAAASFVLFWIVYLVGVRTHWGQTLDATAMSGRSTLSPRAVQAASRLLGTIDKSSLVLVGGSIVLVALLRRRPLLGLGAAVLIGGAILTTEILKKVILTRPDLGVIDPLGGINSFPSGHTTVAMSLAMGAMLVSPSRYRAGVGLIGALYAIGVGVGVVATANHRPSDAVGAVLVVTVWAALTAAALLTVSVRAPRQRRGPVVSPALAIGGFVLLIVAFLGLLATVEAIRFDRLGTIEIGGAFIGAAAAITGTVFLATGLLLAALRGISLDPAPHHAEAEAAPAR
jgi:membrane-associated phospholipid phosphatase